LFKLDPLTAESQPRHHDRGRQRNDREGEKSGDDGTFDNTEYVPRS